jgi:replicative DNA helicase
MSLEAEMVALSALMVAGNPKSAAFVETMAILDRDAFYQKDHQCIFDAVVALAARGDVDGFLVVQEMDKRGTLDEAGGHEYLSRIISAAPTAEHGPEYATIVRERWVARQLLSFANDMRASVYADSTLRAPSFAIGQDAANRLARILSHGAATDSETAAPCTRRWSTIWRRTNRAA